ncbi:MAG: hypothetical protein DRG82_09535 [Deltaproteobacteria bacterium]|nr:MAG: hypothetical protein DRG82_09535 [Deltaproteobacteria bacterium]
MPGAFPCSDSENTANAQKKNPLSRRIAAYLVNGHFRNERYPGWKMDIDEVHNITSKPWRRQW